MLSYHSTNRPLITTYLQDTFKNVKEKGEKRKKKILAQKSLEEDSIQGITCRAFTNIVFPRYSDLSERLFKYFHSCAGVTKHEWISPPVFKQQAEKFLGIIVDSQQIEVYVKMYAEGSDIDQDGFRQLLLQAYKLAMDHYPEGPQTCKQLSNILQAVIDCAFHRKSCVSVTFLSHWIEQHTPRLIVGIHRYVVHMLSTVYREAGQLASAGLELDTPVLERDILFPTSENKENDILPVSEVWLLSSSLPSFYTKPSLHHSPSSSSNGLSSQTFLAKMLGSICPSHWTLLYNSDQHGLGANRFMHHVFGYRGPTLTFLRGQDGVQFCLAADSEWQESHQYWGGEECTVIQILPLYHIVERGAKMMYLNNSIRGYPKGLRAGLDPRKPIIEVNDGFDVVTYRAIPYPLICVQVWGCGSQQSRETQLDIKKWEVKQAEKLRKVKLTADEWVDHPDRYLLELAGRPTYSSNQPQQ
ncbi:uncharacterized protein LOC111871259 isoform X2 [Cryptotermes secundus]|uniref:uncharacterized protein LOC111871259 isoform X2 n=1 Tax=Cryptotermes secundus TaxID=105785 RepID=UPI000CD7D472|nr:uncharacterized protein LOC111871259 isoform X2 [Cryptotermes secundus]